MNFFNILKTNGITNKYTVDIRLGQLGNELFGKDWSYTNEFSSFTKPIIQNEQCHVTIGTNHLYYDCNSNEVNKAGYILTVEHMYHEYRHIQQFTTEHKLVHDNDLTSDYKRMTDIIRRQFVSDLYKTIYDHTYRTDPSEMDSEVYGIENTIRYFSNDPIITQTEAKDMLFQLMLSDDYGHKDELEQYDIKSVGDILSAFIDLRNKVVHIPYSIIPEFETEKSEYDLTDRFLNARKYKYHRKEFKKCKDGRMQDKILEQTIVMEYPEIITLVPRLEKELRECQKAISSRLFVSKNEVIPADKISYANPNENDDFSEAVKLLSADSDGIKI